MKPILLAAVSLGAAAVSASVYADSNSTPQQADAASTSGYVTVSALNVRSGPSLQSPVLTTLAQSTMVTIQERTGDWYKISYNNEPAYVKAAYVSDSPATTAPYTVTADALNVRSGPGSSYPVLHVLSNGTHISVQGETDGWYRVFQNGAIGYVKKEFVTNRSNDIAVQALSSSSHYVNCTALRVRSGPGTGYDSIGLLQQGSQVTVTGKTGSWYEIVHNGKRAFVALQYVKPVTASSAPVQTTALLAMPAEGSITSEFGIRWGSMHYGIDIAKAGTVEVKAAAAGTVCKSYYSNSYGNVVFVAHRLNGTLYTTVYAHLKSRSVNVGQQVQQGQLLGYMGNTGDATGQHLHFELHKGEWTSGKTNALNPLLYLPK
ncbi:SH3 domain-containing protein [Ectobacillus ponti]|uniref:SH3 domain-containing protein n=1 Tax=Ectobacillus ponti TaxID=2961894 RepID=A0AA42BP77_9BACI|nr:SH3 domain-containing protein [Ectobacillus ponti]MCP8968126.1 SH3 domain-containing protein [Ectobacillus ponti]